MRQALVMYTAVVCTLAVGGCGITGSWKRIAVDPPGAPFPVDRVTFDRQHNYTATWSHGGQTRTSTGEYRFSWNILEIMETGRQPRTYRAYRRLDGKLLLTYGEGGGEMTATLTKVQD